MSTDVLPDQAVFNGRYRLLRRLAHGAMGAVYEAVHLETGRRRALKVMLPDTVPSEDARRRFRQEARVAAQIESDFIVDVFDAGVDEATGMPFLVMELLKGEDLGRRLARLGPCGATEASGYIQQLALALDKTHRAGIVHRDLKPENLFLAERDDGPPRIKVIDFGVAKVLFSASGGAAGTRSVGTPIYMAPEQFRMGLEVPPATDVYELGMIAFSLLVGFPYWQEDADQGSGIYAFMLTAARGPTEAASARAARRGISLPEGFDAWFRSATEAAPAARFPGALEAAAGLAAALGVALPLGGESAKPSTHAPANNSTQEPAPKEANATQAYASSRAPFLPLLVAAMFAMVSCFAVGFWLLLRRTEVPYRTSEAPIIAVATLASEPSPAAPPPEKFERASPSEHVDGGVAASKHPLPVAPPRKELHGTIFTRD